MITLTPNDDTKYFKTSLSIDEINFDIELNCQNELLIIRINKQHLILQNFYEKTFSKQELDELNKYFLLFDNILEVYIKFVDLFKNNLFKGELKEEEINLKVETILIDFSLIIPKKESIEMNEFMKQINEENIELKRKIKELEKEKSLKQIEEIKPNIKNKKRQIKKKIIIFLLIMFCFIQIITLVKLNKIIEKFNFKNEFFENNLKYLKDQIDEINDNSFYSSILTKIDEKNMISNWINPFTKIKYKLLFRASQDDDSIETFHEKCDNKGPTLVLIK